MEPRQVTIFDHASHIQVFDADGVKTARQIGCQLVQGILPASGSANDALTAPQSGRENCIMWLADLKMGEV